jgi:hypothetical protein
MFFDKVIRINTITFYFPILRNFDKLVQKGSIKKIKILEKQKQQKIFAKEN